ncbi:YciI-like protein [Legionella geestiana]|uniref:YciI-like protein n=1 Tax=Legionella geestiana TaxID=45065 RepID=A0A0W0TTG7_9GAMM|nr:YciI family protein [Legionella geestiana]KTC99043.1 YciI-like protein [Legionella geestiana]QBS12626.1 YciI family protein [Legionella geestiana]QDQ39656.1 YciI family protein [Legionella geestiana]STX54916.1 YciI-like protein [Legionella geestiana]
MPYLIYARDFDNMDAQREQIREAHREHLRSIGDKLLASGALLDDDGTTVIGGISLIDTEDRAEAEKFANDDPYGKAGIRKETLILKWRQRWWNGNFLKS